MRTTRASWQVLRNIFGADLRSLAALRVGLGLLIIADLIDRSRDLRAHYTDYGLLPRGPLVSRFMNELVVCLHLCTGTAVGMAVLFAVQASVGLFLLIGWRTRLMAVLSWFLMYSLHLRNPVVLQGGDDLLRMLLFWGMFLPLGARYSVDAALGEPTADTLLPRTGDDVHLSVGSVALLIQVLIMYWSTAILKYGAEWHAEGSAVYYALHFDQLALRPALWLRQFYPVTVVLTHLTLAWESLGPFLFLSPVFFGPLRAMAAVGFSIMHFCFAACLMLGLFPYIDLVSMVALLPGWFWQQARCLLPLTEQRAVTIYFDGECGVCQKLARIVREFLILPEVALMPASSDPDVLKILTMNNSWVVVSSQGSATRWQAFVALCRVSPLWRWTVWLLAWGPVAKLGERGYRAVADRRGKLAFISERWLPYRSVNLGTPWYVQTLAAFFLLVICNWNVAGWPRTLILFPDFLRPFCYFWRIDQDWGMFAPFPQKEDGWYVIQGKLHNGDLVDVYNHRPGAPSYDKPEVVSDQYPNQRWSKYMMNIWLARNADYRLYYGQYLCRAYNGVGTSRLPTSLDEFEIFFVKEMTLPDYKSTKPEPVSIWKHYCYEVPKT